MTVNQLSKSLAQMSKPAINKTLNRLTKHNWVDRRSRQDRFNGYEYRLI